MNDGGKGRTVDPDIIGQLAANKIHLIGAKLQFAIILTHAMS